MFKMTKYTLSAIVLCVCAVGVSGGLFKKLPMISDEARPGEEGTRVRRNKRIPLRPCRGKMFLSQRCNLCSFRTKRVTLVVRNILLEPTFEESVTLKHTRFRKLFFIMQEAADIDTTFQFTATYFDAELGFFIDSINKLAGNFDQSQTFWQILDGNNVPTPVGASSYEPYDGETVTFNFTQSSGHD